MRANPRHLAILLGLSVVVAGCGGGAAAPAAAPVAPTPDAGSAGGLAGDTTGGTATTAGPTSVPIVSTDQFKLTKLGAGGAGALDSLFTVKIKTPTDSGKKSPAVKQSDASKATAAVIFVNGTPYAIKKGAYFPPDTKEFQLVAIHTDGVVVSVAGGLFEDGTSQLTLPTNKDVTIQDQSAGISYTLRLLEIGNLDPRYVATAGIGDPTELTSDTTTTTTGTGSGTTGTGTGTDGSSAPGNGGTGSDGTSGTDGGSSSGSSDPTSGGGEQALGD